MNNEEIWKPIKGYEGLYEVSNLGNVKSLNYRKTGKEKILTPIYSNGYLKINLYKDGFKKQHYIHKLVSYAFQEICGKWFDNCECDHIDTNKLNNCAVNLRNVTPIINHNNLLTRKHISESKKGKPSWGKGLKYTTEHCKNISNSLKGKYTLSNNPNAKSIIQLTLNNEFIKKWECIRDVVNFYGYKQPNISRCLTKHSKSAYGYKWIYAS